MLAATSHAKCRRSLHRVGCEKQAFTHIEATQIAELFKNYSYLSTAI